MRLLWIMPPSFDDMPLGVGRWFVVINLLRTLGNGSERDCTHRILPHHPLVGVSQFVIGSMWSIVNPNI